MSKTKLPVTNFSNRTGSPFKAKENEVKLVHEEVLQKTQYEKQKEKHSELIQKVNKKTAEYQANKPSSGFFTEVVTHGAFKNGKEDLKPSKTVPNQNGTVNKTNGTNGSKSLLGFPSSANDLALDAKSDLESDKNISKEVKDKVIEKLFTLVSMVQHVYESKVRVMTEFERFKDVHLKNESRREREHAEQLYKLNMNFQNEVVQAIQRLKSELDISSSVSIRVEENNVTRSSPVDFDATHEVQDMKTCGDTEDLTHESTEEDNVDIKIRNNV